MKKTYPKCFDCPMTSSIRIEILNVGLCKKHADEILVAALLAKAVNSQVKKPLSPSKRK